ncbi:MAG: hypothetical protein K2K90_05230 [Lachnospiraceae bacterium]|nr:hypothetical protein [Lachnospiraceae bacterium]
MNSFNFGRKVEICGEIYYLSRDMEKVAKAMKQCSEKMMELSGDQSISKEAMMDAVRGKSRETIDTVLGVGAFERIFAEEEADILNLMSLVDFITEEINQWKTELEAKVMAGKAVLEKRNER